jgi:hypothetical protein
MGYLLLKGGKSKVIFGTDYADYTVKGHRDSQEIGQSIS